MSKTKIPPDVKLNLVAKAGGRCEYPGCNRLLNIEELTQKKGNFQCFAHIVADSPEGPRGDPARSSLLAKDVSNLMLLCQAHHKLIDVDAVEEHSEDALLEFKRKHEARIEWLTGIQEVRKTKLVFLEARIGERTGLIVADEARRAVLPLYPEPKPLHIDLTKTGLEESSPLFWASGRSEIETQLQRGLAPTLSEDHARHLSVFALGPIPLLMVAGRALGDVLEVEVHQKLRDPHGWIWDGTIGQQPCYQTTRPGTRKSASEVALLLSVSGKVHHEEAEAVIGSHCDVWEVCADTPGPDKVRTKAHMKAFSSEFRRVLTEVRIAYGPDCSIHLFPAVPNSIAVECGRVLLPRADPKILVYNRAGSPARWSFALELSA